MEKKKGILSGLFVGKKSDRSCCNTQAAGEKAPSGSCCDMQIIEETGCTCGKPEEKGEAAVSPDGCHCGK